MKRQSPDVGQEQLLKAITSLLQRAHILYMVTGSVSVIFYGRPRASHDIDFVVDAKRKDIGRITKAFSTLSDEFLVGAKDIETAIVQNHHGFNVLHLPTMLKLDFWLLKDDAFDKERFRRKKRVKLFGQEMIFASPEDTILKKLLWYRESKIEKHLIDAAFVYQIQGKMLDKNYMQQWAKKHKTTKLLQELQEIDLEKYY